MENETGVVDSPQPEVNIADVSTDDLREAIATQPEEVHEPIASETEEQSQEPMQEGDTTSEEVPSTVPEMEETEEEKLAKRRIRPKSELDQQVIDLYRSEGFSGTFADAASVIYGQVSQPNQPLPQPEQRAEPAQDPFEAEAGKLNSEIQELENKVKAAAEDLDTLQALNLQREIMKKELQLQSMQSRKEREEERRYEAQQNTQRSKAEESRDRAFESYPELTNKSSIYRKEFDHFVAEAQRNSDYQAVFSSPRWPEIMAHDFAARKGAFSQPAQPAQPAPQVQQRQVKPALGNQAKVLTTGQTAQPAQQPQTAESLLNNMGQMTNEQLYQMLGTPDGRSFLR